MENVMGTDSMQTVWMGTNATESRVHRGDGACVEGMISRNQSKNIKTIT